MYGEDHPALKGAWLKVRFAEALAGLKLYKPEDGVFTLRQVHSNRVVFLEEDDALEGDALITKRRNFPVGVRTADCVPLAFLGKNAVGVVHAGWRGIKAGVVERFLEKFLVLEEKPLVFVGPSAKACCYQVGQEFKGDFTYLHYRGGELFLDTQLEVLERLRRAGLDRVMVYVQCTICNHKFPSYRRDRTSQRMVLFAMLR